MARREGPVTGFLKRIKDGADQAWDEVQRIRHEDPVIAPAVTSLKGAVRTAAETSLTVADTVAIRIGRAVGSFGERVEETFQQPSRNARSTRDESRILEKIGKASMDSEALFSSCEVHASSQIRVNFREKVFVMRDLVLNYSRASETEDKIAIAKALFNAPFVDDWSSRTPTPEETDWRNQIMHDIWFPLLKEIGGLRNDEIDMIESVLVAS